MIRNCTQNPPGLPEKIWLSCDETLRAWLKSLREARGISQRDLAQKVGVDHYTFISQVEVGRGRIPPDRYRAWVQVLGVPAREFVLKPRVIMIL